MNDRQFGRLGWRVSPVGFGAWALGGGWGPQSDDDSLAALQRFLDLGGNFIDTAQGYGDGRSERLIGRVLAQRPRDRVYVATKIPPAAGSWPPSPYDRLEECYGERYLRERLERSLRDLQTDCIDLVQLHTWTRAWNREPAAFETLRELQREGKIRGIGISTPEHDQNCVIDLMRGGWVDSVQVIYNIFEQEPQAELFPVAEEHRVAVIVRVALDEGALTGKFDSKTRFAADDFRCRYFAGDRLERTVRRVDAIRGELEGEEPALAAAALRFALKPRAVSVVISGIRNVRQADANLAAGAQAPLGDAVERRLRAHQWRRANWYAGK
ncbi:MAG: aldo/keto reductase [Steroidobacteraceae bacterium]